MRAMSPGDSISRIGVLGGTFDPIHRGHIAMARAAIERKALDSVLLVPSGTPPHKRRVEADARDRLEMVRLAVRDEPRMAACDIEVSRPGVSYTVDTLEEIRRLHPRAEIYFIVGADSIPELPGWRRIDRIVELARIITVPRPQADQNGLEALAGASPALREACERDRLEMEPVPVSSTEIRRAIAAGEPFEDDLAAGVAEYIRRERLYGHAGVEPGGKSGEKPG